MCILAALDLGNETSSCFREISKSISEETLPPLMLLRGCSGGSLPRANADEDSYLATGPLANSGFVEDLRPWIVFARAFINEYILSDLYWFESKPRRARCPTRLPNRAVEFWRWLSS